MAVISQDYQTGMLPAAATQLRVVGSLMLREARTRYGKSQFGYLWAVIEPVAIIATFTLVSLTMGHLPPYGNSLLMFFALGTLAFQFYRRVASFCGAAFTANQALLNYPIVKQTDTLVARAALELITCLFVTLMVLGGLMLVDRQPYPAHIEAIAAAVLLLALFGFGFGVINAVIGAYVASWRNIESMLSRPLLILSGVFFVPDRMPPKIIPYLTWNPVLHGVELMRHGYYPDYRSQTLDVPYLFYWAIGLTVLGLAAERAMRIRSARGDLEG